MALVSRIESSKSKGKTETVGTQIPKTQISDDTKLKIVNDLVKFFALEGETDKGKIQFFTASLMKKYRVSKMTIAGIKANLSRGAYGDKTALIAAAKREINKARREAAKTQTA